MGVSKRALETVPPRAVCMTGQMPVVCCGEEMGQEIRRARTAVPTSRALHAHATALHTHFTFTHTAHADSMSRCTAAPPTCLRGS